MNVLIQGVKLSTLTAIFRQYDLWLADHNFEDGIALDCFEDFEVFIRAFWPSLRLKARALYTLREVINAK